jgi:PAS domain S-box-containing protein
MSIQKIFTKRLTLLLLKGTLQKYDKLLDKLFGTVVVVYDIEEAKKKFLDHYIDMVLVEYHDNNKEQFTLINELRQNRAFLMALVVTSSKKANKKVYEECIKHWVDSVFEDSITEIDLIKKLQHLEERYLKVEEYESNKENINLLKQYQEITDKSSIISKTDVSGKITYVNDNFCKISGYTKDELLGKNHRIIRHPDSKKEVFQEMWYLIKDLKKPWNGILKNMGKASNSYYVKSTITPILDRKGNIVEFIALRQNISAILSDKQHFLDKVESNVLSLLVLVQINGFDMLEKFYNLTTVDKIEKMFGFKLLNYLPKEFKFDNVYNLENGRYALLANLDEFMSKQLVISEYLENFVDNVKKATLDIDGIEYDVSISLSYAMGKYMLYEDAKAGLSEAVANNIIVCQSNDFSIKHHEEAKKNLDVIKMVKKALDNYKIVSYFQPIINNATKEIEKYESLVRLVDEDGKICPPHQFLSISKKGTYYNRITQRVLENSFKMLHSIKIKVSINLSLVDIEKDETREYIYKLLDSYKEDCSRLVFELLEEESVKDFNTIKGFVHRVKKLGVLIAIDDFGAGYSNFERLLEFEPDIIKIDGSLIRNIINNEYNQNVVETIVSFAKKQNIQIIAEFVETKEIFEYLYQLGVDYSQGYYFGEPEDLNSSNSLSFK